MLRALLGAWLPHQVGRMNEDYFLCLDFTGHCCPRQTVTRRQWKNSYAARFKKDDVVWAYTRQPRYGGKLICPIILIEDPYKEDISIMPDSDYAAEGFLYMHLNQRLIPQSARKHFVDYDVDEFKKWRDSNIGEVWVVHFDYAMPEYVLEHLEKEAGITR